MTDPLSDLTSDRVDAEQALVTLFATPEYELCDLGLWFAEQGQTDEDKRRRVVARLVCDVIQLLITAKRVAAEATDTD